MPLSHDNILANCRDVAAILALDSHDAMLAMLPPFHTLGLTGNIVLPLCFGVSTQNLDLPIGLILVVVVLGREIAGQHMLSHLFKRKKG